MAGKKTLWPPTGDKAGTGCLIPEKTKNFLLFSIPVGELDLLPQGPLTATNQNPERTPRGVQENCVNPSILLCKSLACLQSPHSSSLRSHITSLAEIPCSSHAGTDRQETEKQNRKTEEDNAQNREQKAVSRPSQRLLRARLP